MAHSRNLLFAGLAAALLWTSGMGADELAAPPSALKREGFLIGFSLGYGATFPCETCADFGGEFHVGAMASSRLAVLAELGLMGGDEQSNGGLLLATIGAQYWPAERVWIKGGVGIGNSLDSNEDEDRGWGATAAVGYEVARKDRFAFDIQAHGAFISGRQSLGLNLGFHWY